MPLPSSGPLSLNDIQTEFGGTNPIGMNEYYAGGGLVPAGTTGTFGAVPSSGALSVQNFYGTSQFVPVYIEEVFKTWLYNGSNSAQTITNGIDLLGKGGLVWLKGINVGSQYGYGDHELFDSANVGSTRRYLRSDGTDALGTNGSIATTPFTSSGFNLDAGPEINNRAGDTNVSWTFREQPKFFDIVTYTGDGSSTRNIPHNLGSVPGCIMVKRTDGTADWLVYHKDITRTQILRLNLTAAATNIAVNFWGVQTATDFVVGSGGSGFYNVPGQTYVVYLFAHNAGGFGLSGTDNVITCGVFTGSGNINLGYEPQWLLFKQRDDVGNWRIVDNMRGWPISGNPQELYPNLAQAESSNGGVNITSTGFFSFLGGGETYIYIAIRRGPMKVPTTGTSVYTANTLGSAGDSTAPAFRSSFPVDFAMWKNRTGFANWRDVSRLTPERILASNSADAETSGSLITFNFQNGWYNSADVDSVILSWMFSRAAGFMDVVCYTGTGVTRTLVHNLTVVPELMIVKSRNSSEEDWAVYVAPLGPTVHLRLNSTNAQATGSNRWGSTTPTASVFTVGDAGETNRSGFNFINYIFTSCPGVSKVGSFTGTGATQVINCGFTAGSRFVLIKSTSASGDWYVWDSFRGIVAGNDPYLALNSAAAQVTTTDWVDTAASGFELSNAGGNLANSSGVSYIFLAIA